VDWKLVRDIIQTVGGIAGFASIVAVVYYYLNWTREREARLGYAFGDSKHLLPGIPGLPDAPHVFSLTTRLQNIGDVPLNKDDIVQPISFSFDTETLFQSVSSVWTVPENTEPNVTTELSEDRKTVSVSYDNLNRRQQLYLEFRCEGKMQTPLVSGHIRGVERIELIDYEVQPLSARIEPWLLWRVPVAVLLCLAAVAVLRARVEVTLPGDVLGLLNLLVSGRMLGQLSKALPATRTVKH